MARRTCRACRDRSQAQAQTQAQAQAAAIIAQGRQVAAGLLQKDQGRCATPAVLEEEEPMNRYIHPIDLPVARCPGREAGCAEVQATLERVLECMACQNQLLVDILGAVNALTASLLSAQSRT